MEAQPDASDWEPGSVRAVALAAFGDHYRRYRLPDESAEGALQRSLERYGQMSPVVVCVRNEVPEVLDGFKRVLAARRLPRWTTLLARRLAADERHAKAAIYGLNRAARPTQELEEAWIVQALVREDGLNQVEVAELLGRHKSWVCRRLAVLERLDPAVRDELRLGLLGPTTARALVLLPAGNQVEVLGCARREQLRAGEIRGVVDLVRNAGNRAQVEYVLAKPRQALAASQAGPRTEYDPRLSPAGNRIARQLATLLEQLGRMEGWLRNRGRAELWRSDCGLLRERFERLGRAAQSVSGLARDLSEELEVP